MVTPKYPKQYDDTQNGTPPYLPNISGTTNAIEYVQRIRNALITVERELGINPSGAQTTVSARLDLLENGGGDTGTGQSIHRSQIADKYSLNDIYNRQLVVGQISLNGLDETNLSNSAQTEVTITLMVHVYVQANTVLTTGLYDITTGVATLIKQFTFNNGSSYVGGHFTQSANLNIVSDIPLSDRVYEFRVLQVATATATTEEKSIVWDASLLIKSTNDGYTDGYGTTVIIGGSGGGSINEISPIFTQQTVSAVASTPGWETIGAFVYNGDAGKLQAMVLVSNSSLTANLRLYGPIDGYAPAAITNSDITTTSTTEILLSSSAVTSYLTTGKIYQIQMECVGGTNTSDFAIARYAALVAT